MVSILRAGPCGVDHALEELLAIGKEVEIDLVAGVLVLVRWRHLGHGTLVPVLLVILVVVVGVVHRLRCGRSDHCDSGVVAPERPDTVRVFRELR